MKLLILTFLYCGDFVRTSGRALSYRCKSYKPANMHLLCQLKLVPVAPKRDLFPLVYFPLNHSQGTFGTDPKERYSNYIVYFSHQQNGGTNFHLKIEGLNLK